MVNWQGVRRLGMFQKVNEWLTEHGGRLIRGGEANQIPAGAYYASSEAEQAYGGMRYSAQDTAGEAVPMPEMADPYDGRVPYRSQRDLQAEADMQRQQMEQQARQQQSAAQQQRAQTFNRPGVQAVYPQQQQQQSPGNILQFPGMVRGPEGNLYAHVEYVVLLRNRNECTKIIEYIKANASVFLNMEFIANDSERQRCVDMLSGAAYTLGCRLSKISQRGIYLISAPSVYVVIDQAMQKFTSTPDMQGSARSEYARYPAYDAGGQNYGYAAPGMGYAAGAQPQGYAQPNAYAQPSVQPVAYARQQEYGWAQPGPAAAQQGAGFGVNRQPQATFATPPAANYPGWNAGYEAQPAQQAGYAVQPDAGYAAQMPPEGYRAQHASRQTAEMPVYPPMAAAAGEKPVRSTFGVGSAFTRNFEANEGR
jgi:FtsZ-interacting cell division protein YlmF